MIKMEFSFVEFWGRKSWVMISKCTFPIERNMANGATYTITSDDIEAVHKPSVWDVGNQILYDMCTRYPGHTRSDEIIAKIWLIGRTYAASIERRKNADLNNDDFYELTVAPEMKMEPIDSWLAAIKSDDRPGSSLSVTIHKRMMGLFYSFTELEKRSLASKYLHFHRPNAFFIYDSRVKQSITKVAPRLNAIPEIETDEFDLEYKNFVRRCNWLKNYVLETFDVSLSPREIDKLLLKIGCNVKRKNIP